MESLDSITLSPPTFPQAHGTDTINIHDLSIMGTEYILMEVPRYDDAKTGDEIEGYLYLSDDNSVVIKSRPYTVAPDKLHTSPYTLLFTVDEFSKFGTYQAKYKVISHGNERESPTVNIKFISFDSSKLSDYIPSVPEATGKQGTLLTKDDYYRLDKLEVIVPVYEGMAPGHAVKILWKGRRSDITYEPETQIVTEVIPMTFYIPRMEFIDTIGDTATLYFSVTRTSGSDAVEYSGDLQLEIEGQALNLPAPNLEYNDDSIQVIIRYPGMRSNQTVNIRLVGQTMWQTNYQVLDNIERIAIDIPSDWVQENSGKLVLIDYAVGDIYGNRDNFSHILRRVL
ncbi:MULTISPECIES: hypothetical protein [Xenorhabdus]|uniref:hypothetical protein n=1 Tax=Xenorhabdus TaxID=626 RepID=UPI00064A71F3|nr:MULTISPECIES: hypothetical protein [Xenorhabdus]KLU14075.1 hypothetical protein AAY47_18350 [Xenorhabdus griffiniae]KOP32112.1 hypothetical protein AFK69_17005 [Xenorhabdus sp. GDc328]